MAIINPRFAFLEADLENPNLNKDKIKMDHSIAKSNEIIQIKSEDHQAPKISTSIYLKSLPIFVFVNAVPVEIYSAAIFLLVKDL